MSRYNKAGTPTTLEVAEAIETLRNALFREYGCDYSFAVVGRGYVLGASNKVDGVIHAVTSDTLVGKAS